MRLVMLTLRSAVTIWQTATSRHTIWSQIVLKDEFKLCAAAGLHVNEHSATYHYDSPMAGGTGIKRAWLPAEDVECFIEMLAAMSDSQVIADIAGKAKPKEPAVITKEFYEHNRCCENGYMNQTHDCRKSNPAMDHYTGSVKKTEPPYVEFFKPEDFAAFMTTNGQRNYCADQANRLLAKRGTVVFGHWKGPSQPAYWGPREGNRFDDTHTALLINIQPIARPDIADRLLRELVGKLGTSVFADSDVTERAKAYLKANEK